VSLDNAWQIEQTWGSNQPVLRGVVEGLHPVTAVECGCGNYSTPILTAGVDMLVSVEHDRRWAREVESRFPSSATHLYLLHPLNGIKNGTPHAEVPPAVLNSLYAFYSGSFADTYDFILIDTFRCARVAAALALMERTPLLMLHDVEPKSREYYGFYELDAPLSSWHRYEHRPQGFVNRVHKIPWTALYSREPLDLSLLQPAVIAESQRLWGLDVGLVEIDG